MIKAIYVNNETGQPEIIREGIEKVLEQKPKLIWVDVTVEDHDLSSDELSLLYDKFKFHELSIEDSLIPQYHPQVEEFENYIFVAVHGIRGRTKEFAEIEKMIYELDIFIGKDFIVTMHAGDVPCIETLFEKAKLKPQIDLKSVENLLYGIFHKVVNSYDFSLEKINETIDTLEDRVIEDPYPEIVEEIFDLKRALIDLRKINDPQRNIYSYFMRENMNPIIPKKSVAYFRDIFFQYDRVNQLISSYTQSISSIMEMYVSGVTLKLNEVMKFLTVIATLFLPAVLVASYFGMNVDFPEHKIFGDDRVWYFAMGLIVASTIGIFLYIKKKKWL